MSAVGIWEAAIDKYHRFLTGLILENDNEQRIVHYGSVIMRAMDSEKQIQGKVNFLEKGDCT